VAGCGEEKGSTVGGTAEEEERGERVVERRVVGDA